MLEYFITLVCCITWTRSILLVYSDTTLVHTHTLGFCLAGPLLTLKPCHKIAENLLNSITKFTVNYGLFSFLIKTCFFLRELGWSLAIEQYNMYVYTHINL